MPKTALITGATSGFGAACAQHFAKEGWRLILTGRRNERLEELRKDLGEAVTAVITLELMPVDQAWGPLAVHREKG